MSGRAKGRTVKIVLGCVFGLILLLIVIVEGTLLVQKYIKKSTVPMFMGYASMIVATGSMNGTIDEGDLIFIKKTDEYSLGDIVTFFEDGATIPVTHRLINYGPTEGTFITKGDANKVKDTFPVKEEQIVGKVVFVIPKLGLVFDWFLTGGGIIYVAAFIIIIVVAVYFLKRIYSEPETAEGGESPEKSDKGENVLKEKTEEPLPQVEADNSYQNEAEIGGKK